MSLIHTGVVAAFLAGLVSFLSPCIFPLVPGYLAYLAGTSLGEVSDGSGRRWRVTLHAFFFVGGFAVIFALLGAGASVIGASLIGHKQLLEQISGLFLILFGLVATGVLPLSVLQREHRMHVAPGEGGLLRSVAIGAAFAAGWSPCIGPVLGSILALAASSATLAQGTGFLLVYAAGLGVPFLLVAVLVDQAPAVVRRINRYTRLVSVGSGGIMIVTGLLIISGRLAQLANLAPVFIQ